MKNKILKTKIKSISNGEKTYLNRNSFECEVLENALILNLHRAHSTIFSMEIELIYYL